MVLGPVVNLFKPSNYSFDWKESRIEKDASSAEFLIRFKNNYLNKGMRTSVHGILLVQEHNHPHILLLKNRNEVYTLPGGRLFPGENEIKGLKRKLTSKFESKSSPIPHDWKIRECVGVWWRPNFETLMYPYCPPHITKPKECKKLFIVQLPEGQRFVIPENLKLLAVPLFELHDNGDRFGAVISAIPLQLSRFTFNAM